MAWPVGHFDFAALSRYFLGLLEKKVHLIKTSKTALFVLSGLLALVSAGAGLAQSPPSAQRAPPSLETRVESMESHYASGRFMPALVVSKRLCLQDNVMRACVIAGDILSGGKGVAASRRDAVTYLNHACAARDASGCVRLGRTYEAMLNKEIPVEDVIPLASDAYEKGCDLGDKEGCILMGEFLSFTSRHEDARRGYSKACAMGDGQSCANLAFYIEEGRGAPPDAAAAKAQYRKACALGHKESCSLAK